MRERKTNVSPMTLQCNVISERGNLACFLLHIKPWRQEPPTVHQQWWTLGRHGGSQHGGHEHRGLTEHWNLSEMLIFFRATSQIRNYMKSGWLHMGIHPSLSCFKFKNSSMKKILEKYCMENGVQPAICGIVDQPLTWMWPQHLTYKMIKLSEHARQEHQ